MTKQQKLDAISNAFTSMEKQDKTISIYSEKLDKEVKDKLFDIQQSLDIDFELSYEIMADACQIIGGKTITGTDSDGSDRDSLTGDDLDFYADADSMANVYTGVQLSYLNIKNESEISDLMKDESIESIAQACSIWYSQKVAEVCEQLKDYILTE